MGEGLHHRMTDVATTEDGVEEFDRAGLQTGRAFVFDRFFRSGRGFGRRAILGVTFFASPLPGKKM